MNRFARHALPAGLCLFAITGTALAEGCGRLKTGDTFDDLNRILDCIEARIGGSKGAPVVAGSVATYGEEIEPNDRIGEANQVALGTSLNGTLKDGNEFDIFTFVAPADAESVRVILRHPHPSGFYPRLTIYDRAETAILRKLGAVNETLSVAVETTPGQPYYITIACDQVCRKNMPYELLVRPD